MGVSLVLIAVVSLGPARQGLSIFRDFGDPPLRVALASSPSWPVAWTAFAALAVLLAAALRERRDAQAVVLVSAVMLLLTGVGVTLWAAAASTCLPLLGEFSCCMSGAIR